MHEAHTITTPFGSSNGSLESAVAIRNGAGGWPGRLVEAAINVPIKQSITKGRRGVIALQATDDGTGTEQSEAQWQPNATGRDVEEPAEARVRKNESQKRDDAAEAEPRSEEKSTIAHARILRGRTSKRKL